jgi:antitoxin FitA
MALIEIRDVPDDVHEAVRRRARPSGRSIEAYLHSRIIEMARRPTPSEVVAALRTGLRRRPPLVVDAELLLRDGDRGPDQAWTTGTS